MRIGNLIGKVLPARIPPWTLHFSDPNSCKDSGYCLQIVTMVSMFASPDLASMETALPSKYAIHYLGRVGIELYTQE